MRRCALWAVLLGLLLTVAGCDVGLPAGDMPAASAAPTAPVAEIESVAVTPTPPTSPPTTTPAPSPTAPLVPDRLSWHAITATDANVPLEYLVSLTVAPDGGLWIGSDNDGLFRYDGAAWQQYTTADGLSDNSVHSIVMAPDGTVWVTTWYGASRLEGDRWHSYPFDLDFVGNDRHPLTMDREGGLWVGGGRGLLLLREDGWEPVVLDEEAGPQGALALLAEPSGTVWVASGPRGLYRVQDGLAESIPLTVMPTGVRIGALLPAVNGALWVGTSHGMYLYLDGGWETPQDGLPNAYVTSLALAPDGALWIGTHGQGVRRYTEQGTQIYTVADGLPDSSVWALAMDQRGRLYAATSAGLAWCDTAP